MVVGSVFSPPNGTKNEAHQFYKRAHITHINRDSEEWEWEWEWEGVENLKMFTNSTNTKNNQ